MPKPEPNLVPVRINQLGYRPDATKRAALANDVNVRLPWILRDNGGHVVARGRTWVLGTDPASEDHIHEIDFSCVAQPGPGYRLQVEAYSSPPFPIREDVYDELRREAFASFYRERSAVTIDPRHAGERWGRAAGHPGDADVGCSARSPCPYRLDAGGGWYGDGALGKYVVGSALAVWTLQNLYERYAVGGREAEILRDGILPVPEAGNRRPDVLDLARWHLEWMLAMQVPAGQPNAGLVHHKLHGDTAPVRGTAPNEDRSARSLRPPTTYATLNLAAVAAQAARLWKDIDPAFAERCLDAAERAWETARTSQLHTASSDDAVGGLSYADGTIEDEAYWSSVELALTTGKSKYLDYATASALHLRPPPTDRSGPPPLIYWDMTQGLGILSLAVVGGVFETADIEAAREVVTDVADGYVQSIGRGGYRMPLQQRLFEEHTTFDMLRDAIVIELASDWSNEPRYRLASSATLDWILGRNALGRTYVTGFGSNPVEHPRHLYWSDDPPPGLLVNGPDSALASTDVPGCAPEKCYVDDIGSAATNRITDHGNAALAWVVAALAEP